MQMYFAPAGILLMAATEWIAGGNAAARIDPSGNLYAMIPLNLFSTVLFCSAVFILMALWIHRSWKVSRSEAVYAAALGYVSEHLAYCTALIFRIIFPFFGAESIGSAAAFPYAAQLLFSVVSAVFFAAAADVLFASRMLRGEHYQAQTKETAVLISAVIFVVMVLSAAAAAMGHVLWHGMYAALFCLYVMLAQIERQKALAGEKEAAVREQILISQKTQYESYRENIDLVNRKCHDLKHQTEALRYLDAGSERDRAIAEMEQAVLIYDSFLKTGNETLDVILTQKNHICVEREILFTCIADGAALSFMEAADLFTLFGNLLDNAVEAVSALPKEHRSISLSVKKKAGMVNIREENPCGTVHLKQGRFLTTKENKSEHGYGLRSMEIIMEKYGGVMNAAAQDGVFSLTAILPEAQHVEG